jgi:ADP-ribose pyrophosphatase YjhB (NUDIX family)
MTSIENSVNCVILGFKERQLHILLIKRKESPEKGTMALPGDFLNKLGEFRCFSKKTLKAKTNLQNIF